MKAMDLTQFIKGLLVLISISVAVGKYDALQDFARREAAASLREWPTHPFVPITYRRVIGAPTEVRVHPKRAAASYIRRSVLFKSTLSRSY